jgi:hypothetical protein
MTIGRRIPADLAKEIRALAPIWIGCLAIVWAAGVESFPLGRANAAVAGFLTYVLGSAALGALSMGHEYTNRTLPLLLSTPISRRRIFVTKAAVLVAMLLTLAAVGFARLPVGSAGREMQDTRVISILSLVSSVFLAPWLTMVCRNVIAGAVFTLWIPAAVLLGSEFLAIAIFGVAQIDTADAVRFRAQVLWGGMLLLSAAGAVGSCRAFMTLEIMEGSRSEFRLPRLFHRLRSSAPARETPRRIHPIWSLVGKELRLQQLTFVVSALYVLGWIATLIIHRLVGTGSVEDALLILTVVNGVIVALLSGSLASAEERHLGVLESQVLIPVSMARQWAIKAGVVFGLCVVLAIGLPAALFSIYPGAASVRINVPLAIVVIFLAGLGLYVSSVSTSGVKALLISGPVALSLVVLIPLLGDVVLGAGRLFGITTIHDPFGPGPTVLIAVIVSSLLVGFGLPNHRSSDRSFWRIWRQILWLSGSVTGVMLITLVLSRR